MEFKMNKASLAAALERAAGIADAKSTMPQLAMACLRATATQLLVVGTDLNLTTVSTMPLIGSTPGGLCINAKKLHGVVSGLPGADVSFKRVENGGAEIKAGKTLYRLVGLPDRDYPKVPDATEVTFVEVDAEVLGALLERTLFSVCNDETRFHLNGVLLEVHGQLVRMVSTDGHRLSKADRKLEVVPKMPGTAGIIIPKKGALEVGKLAKGTKTIEVAVKNGFLFVRRTQVVLAVKLIDAQFPPYDQVIPKKYERRAVIDAGLFKEAVARCGLMASETRGLRLGFDAGKLTMRTENPDVGEVVEELDCEYSDRPITIGVNPKYVADLMPRIGDTGVAVELNNELDPIVFRPADDPDGYMGVVMPMRV